MDKRFPNNYAWAGVTAIQYNVEIPESYTLGDDIGFRWKDTSSSFWTNVSLTEYNGHYRILRGNYCNSPFEERYYSIHYSDSLPIRIMITGLSASTNYTIESYYDQDGIKTYYNRFSISTLAQRNNISWDGPIIDKGVSVSQDDLDNNFIPGIEEAVDLIRMWGDNIKDSFTVTIKNLQGVGVANSSMNFDYRYVDYDKHYTRSTAIHELAHRNMTIITENDRLYTQEYKLQIMKFMEFATGRGGALWRWDGTKHNYPIISSNRYSYIDDCLIVAAWGVS